MLDGLSGHLKCCPLFCTLLCVLYEEEGDRSLGKFTQIYRGIITWLVRRTSKRLGSTKIAGRSVSEAKYEKALFHFGSMCLTMLSKRQVQFSVEQLKELPGNRISIFNPFLHKNMKMLLLIDNSGDLILELGLLVPKNTSQCTTIIPENSFYQPIQKTFIEYLVAFYFSKLDEISFTDRFGQLQSELNLEHDSLLLILKFTAGLLGKNAGHIMFRNLWMFDLPVMVLFNLLDESGATTENVKIITSLVGDEMVLIRSNRIELDGWADLLLAPDCPIRAIKFIWYNTTDAPFSSAAMERFLRAFQSNCSVTCLVMRSSMGFFPNDDLVAQMSTFVIRLLKKPHLHHIDLQLMGDTWSTKIVDAINSSLNYVM